jgi:hypothetical protein
MAYVHAWATEVALAILGIADPLKVVTVRVVQVAIAVAHVPRLPERIHLGAAQRCKLVLAPRSPTGDRGGPNAARRGRTSIRTYSQSPKKKGSVEPLDAEVRQVKDEPTNVALKTHSWSM